MNTPLPLATEKMLTAKKAKNLTFAQIGELLNADEVWVASAIYRQSTLSPDQARALADALELDDETTATLSDYPTKGLGSLVPTDPLVYRFYEIMQVYGLPLKSVIQERFGDGIMSAIDFTMTVDKVEDPKGDRVVVTMNGKFLPYKKW